MRNYHPTTTALFGAREACEVVLGGELAGFTAPEFATTYDFREHFWRFQSMRRWVTKEDVHYEEVIGDGGM